MKRLWARAIMVAGVATLLIAVYFMFGMGENYKSLSPDEAARMMENNPDCLVADVRTQAEYDGGHIPGAICVPIADIREGKVDALPDKYQTVLIYCYAGRRAEEAAKILTSMGYRNTYEFGGIVDWKGPVTDPLPDADAETSETEVIADAGTSETEVSADAGTSETEVSADAGTSETEVSADAETVKTNQSAETQPSAEAVAPETTPPETN